ncbi:AAA family ATPase [Sulfoacidibacillus thermotolerans]|uniref:Uncharacterized protein n=1 Tax=Sulfoacidibacillus thermotolerans TaxID=1765684 RepID=A0A2U3DAH8_SULT2|nr:AAA family ATPase [Sulfoacidibacillus thermotolerans]PWI56837.1 hypothetical protein BM613_11850 [Sulfoacidibacillus thermotolerans]PWI58262.1 hypothetical protein BM613_04930 [Sulfoacidibacillus thermotolerans]
MYEVQGVHEDDRIKEMNRMGKIDEYAYEYACRPRALAFLNVQKKYGAIVDSHCHSIFCPVHGGEERAEIAKNITMYANMYHLYEFVTLTHSSDLKSPEEAERAYDELKEHFQAVVEQMKNLKFSYYLGRKRFRDKNAKKTDEQYYLKWLRWIDQVIRYEYITNFRRVARSAIAFAIHKRRLILDVQAAYAEVDAFLDESYQNETAPDVIVNQLRERYAYLKGYKKLGEALENVRFKVADYFSRLSDYDEYKFPSSSSAISRYVMNDLILAHNENKEGVRALEIENETKNHVNEKITKFAYIGTWEVGKGGHLHVHALVNYPVFSYFIEKSRFSGETMQVYDVKSVNRSDANALSDYMVKLGQYQAKTDIEDIQRLASIGIFGHRHTEKGVVRGKSVYFVSDNEIKVHAFHRIKKQSGFVFAGFTKRRNIIDRIGNVRGIDVESETPVLSRMIDRGASEIEIKMQFREEVDSITESYTLWLSQNEKAKEIWKQVLEEYEDAFFKDMCETAYTHLTKEQLFFALRETQYVEFIKRYAAYRAGLDWTWYAYFSEEGFKEGKEVAGVEYLSGRYDHVPKITNEQLKIMNDALFHSEIVVKADAGSGKTFTLVNFLNYTPFDPKKVAVLSYTASVAQKLRSELDARYSQSVQTVDAFLGMRRRARKTVYAHNFHNVASEIELVIIDEYERLTPDKKALLYMSLPEDVRILNFGDTNQIGAFGHKFGALENLPGVELFFLTKNFRVRKGFKNHGEDFVKDFEDRKDEIVQAVLSGTKVLVNVHKIRRLVNQWVLEELDRTGKRGINRIRVGGYIFAEGDQVVIKRNRKHNDDERFNSLNGEEGTMKVFMGGRVQYAPFVNEYYDEAMIAVELSNGKGIRLFRHSELLRYTDTIQHAYAITIQSSQGKEYENGMVLLARTQKKERNKYFASQEMYYTAISRARSSVKVITNLLEGEFEEYTGKSSSYDYLDDRTLNEKDFHSDHAVLIRTIRYIAREKFATVV